MLDLDWAVILTLLTALAELFNGWLCGLMDKASDFGSEDCRFESCHSRKGMGSFLRAPRLGHEESDMPELLHFHFSLSCIREGNGNPLQYSKSHGWRSLVGCSPWGLKESDTLE